MNLSRIGVPLGALALAVIATPANAVTSPRLVGTWNGNYKVTVVTGGTHDRLGATGTTKFAFTPQCATGGCVTKDVRTRISGHPAQATPALLTPSGATYTGSTTYLSGCFFGNGTVFEKGQKTAERTTINVTATNAQHVATAWTGTLKLTFTPTAAGSAAGCLPGGETLALKSGTRIS
jgi:hypothetical protein